MSLIGTPVSRPSVLRREVPRLREQEAARDAEQAGLQPTTLKALFEAYVADLEAAGRGPTLWDVLAFLGN